MNESEIPTTVAEWEALEARYQADKRLWKLFTNGDRALNWAPSDADLWPMTGKPESARLLGFEWVSFRGAESGVIQE